MPKDIENRKIKDNGEVIVNYNGLIESLFVDPNQISKINIEDNVDITQYNQWAKVFDFPKITQSLETTINHDKNQNVWFMPEEYKHLDIRNLVLEKCNAQGEIDRVTLEYALYEERDLIDMLRYMVYLVDVIRKEKISRGPGRGSSCSSYILFLLGVHFTDALKYNLPITDFLK